jgi:DNA-directed RNA polymerase subunit RPC12/RpoP
MPTIRCWICHKELLGSESVQCGRCHKVFCSSQCEQQHHHSTSVTGRCPKCKALYEVGLSSASEAQETIACPRCGERLDVPTPKLTIQFRLPERIAGVVTPFAMIDALGFRQLVRKASLTEVYKAYMLLVGTAWAAARVPEKSSPQFFVFSDTLFIFPPSGDACETLERFIECVAALIGSSLGLAAAPGLMGLPLRGAVSFGEIVADSTHHFPAVTGGGLPQLPEFPLFLGLPIVEAYEWEQQQKWIGASLDPRCIGPLKERCGAAVERLCAANYLLDWDVPTAHGPVRTLAINHLQPKEVDSYRRALVDAEARHDREVAAKYLATRRFLEHVIAQGRYIPPAKS